MSSPLYTQGGKFSKAWWLLLIKREGVNGGQSHLADLAGKAPYQIKPVLDELTMAGYVEMIGKGGRGFRPRYRLTSFGHRYLEEHKLEAVGAEPEGTFLPTTPPPEPVRHVVPATPRFEGPSPKPNPDYGLVRKPQDRAVRGGDELPKMDDPVVLSVPPILLPHVPVTQPAPDTETPPPPARSLKDDLRDILAELMIEKFADQVTVRELLDHMEERG